MVSHGQPRKAAREVSNSARLFDVWAAAGPAAATEGDTSGEIHDHAQGRRRH
jgi:hypothetical protein